MDRVLDQRYRIEAPLGRGGSAQVYLAHDAVLNREVAIKVLDDQATLEDGLRRQFVKEARALAALTHPHIVAIYDVGEVDGRPFIVMEHVAGSSLKERVERTGPLSLDDAVRLATQIAGGLGTAHARGIVHADLKPSNVLVNMDDNAKICDFGIARTPQEEAETPQLFATALYIAPERVEGKPASMATDIYGLGLVLYEMLVGRPPFTSGSASVLLRDHLVRQPVPPSHLRPSLPKSLDAVVLKALAKDPALRFRDAAEFTQALARSTDFGATQLVMTHPIEAFVPPASQSPVIGIVAEHGETLRHGFFSLLAGLPVFGLALLAGLPAPFAVLLAAPVLLIGAFAQVGSAVALAWILQTMLLFLFVPGLALLFAILGVVLWLRDTSAEQTALALAMPVTAPLGLAPALVLGAAAIQGIGGVVTVAWGAVMTVVFAIASGQTVLGPFVHTGLTLERDTLFGASAVAQMRDALMQVVQPAPGQDRFGPLARELDPQKLWNESGLLLSRIAGADLSALATILAWIIAALVVWAITRLLRAFFDTLLRRRQFFALYVFATTVGSFAGGAVLYMLFVTTSPLAQAAGRSADSVLLLSALTGALLAIVAGVIIGATESGDPDNEALPGMNGRRI